MNNIFFSNSNHNQIYKRVLDSSDYHQSKAVKVAKKSVDMICTICRLERCFTVVMKKKEFILSALKANKGKINQTVAQANIPKNTLLRKIRKYGINVKDFMD